MRGRMHHLDFSVSDAHAAYPLYSLFLIHMGYVEADHREDGYTEWDHPADGYMSVGIAPTKGPNAHRPHDRYSPGLHHAAWLAASKEDVDALYAKLTAFGATILDAPADYPKYNGGRGYYAVFFADPDGLKLEYVWTPRPALA
jgi:glyoxylase I family protein